MVTLTEIEAATDSLSKDDKEALLRFLVVRLREERATAQRRAPSNLTGFAGILRLTSDPLDWQHQIRGDWE